MDSLSGTVAAIKAKIETMTLPGINKKHFQPPLESIAGLPVGAAIITWDRVEYQGLSMAGNDAMTIYAAIDFMVKPGGAFAAIDALRDALRADPGLGHAVMSSEIIDADLANPSGGIEGCTVRLKFTR